MTWMVPHRLMLIEVADVLKVDEIVALNQDFLTMINSDGQPPVHMLVDARLLESLDIKVKDIPQLLVGSNGDKRFGWSFIVTHNRFVGFLTNMASHLTGSHFKTTDSLEEALQAFTRIDPTLPPELLIGRMENAS